MFFFLWLLPPLSAVILAVGLEYSFLGLLSLVGFLPLLVFIKKAQGKKTVFFGGWLSGFLFFCLNLRWFFSTFSFNWAEIPNSVSMIPVVVFVWFILSFGMGISFGIFALLVFKLETGGFSDFIIIPSAWVVAELIKTELFMLISWGPGGSLFPHWMMGNIGLALIDTPLIFWSRLFGIYGMGFLVVFLNVLIFYCFKNVRLNLITVKDFALLFFVFLLLLILPGFLFSVESEDNTLKVALLQTNSRLGSLKSQEVSNLWKEAKKTKGDSYQLDVVVFPEGFTLFPSMNDEDEILLRQFFPDENQDGLVVTSVIESDSQVSTYPKEKIIYRDQKGVLIDMQEKTFLIPAGEFLPLSVKSFIKLKDDSGIIVRLIENRVLSPGDTKEHSVDFEQTKLATLLCSGVLSPSLYRDLAKGGAEVFINSASLTIFDENPSFFHQIKNMARFQAISNARPFIQSANGGPAFYIDGNGEVVNRGSFPKAQFVLAEVAPVKEKTIFTKLGDWPILFLVLFFIFGAFIRNRKSQSWGPR